MPSRQDVERAVARQVMATVPTASKGSHANVACAEGAPRHYTCRVDLILSSGTQLGSVTAPPATVHAVVSKDGKRIVVEDL